MEKKLRRLQNNLVVAGSGLVVFTFWSVVRIVIMFFTFNEEMLAMFRAEMEGEEVSTTVIVIAVIIVLLLVALPYLYIGKCARDEGRGKKSRRVYIVLAIIMLIPQISGTLYSVANIFNPEEDLISTLVTAMIDITTSAVLLETVITAFRVKKYRKMLGNSETEGKEA